MATQTITASLTASRKWPGKVLSSEFAAKFRCKDLRGAEPWGAETGPSTSGIRLFALELSTFSNREAPHDAFEEATAAAWQCTADWLRSHPVSMFQECRDQGMQLELIVNTWIDCDQIDLHFPPALLQALGERGISLYALSNE